MKGKNKCKLLKEIRQRIADENEIPYVTRACSYQGDCTGTCPKCEAELRYLERELEKRRSLGQTVAVAAVATGLSLSLAGCVPGNGSTGNALTTPSIPTPETPVSTSCPEFTELAGDIAIDDALAPEASEDESGELLGQVMPEPDAQDTELSETAATEETR